MLWCPAREIRLVKAAGKMLFKQRASPIISFEAFLGHALFALCYKIHFDLEASRGLIIRNKAVEKCRQKPHSVVRGCAGSTRSVNAQSLAGNESHRARALRNCVLEVSSQHTPNGKLFLQAFHLLLRAHELEEITIPIILISPLYIQKRLWFAALSFPHRRECCPEIPVCKHRAAFGKRKFVIKLGVWLKTNRGCARGGVLADLCKLSCSVPLL